MNNSAKQPITFLQLLKSSWYYYKNYFVAILLLSLIICIPVHVLEYLVNLLLPSGASASTQSKTLNLLTSMLITFISLLQLISINLLIKKAYGSPQLVLVNWLDCLKMAIRNYGGFVWVTFLTAVTLGVPYFLLGFIFTIVPMLLSTFIGSSIFDMVMVILSVASLLPIIFIAPYLSFTPQANLFKGIKGIMALKYSYSLVKGRYWRVFFLYALIIGIGFIITLVYAQFKPFLPSGYGLPIVYSTILSITTPFFMIYNVLLFLHMDKTQKHLYKDPSQAVNI